MDHSRLSINGWFHTLTPDKYITPILEQPKTGIFGWETLPPLMIEFPLENWISRQYLQSNTQKQIQKHIENDSEICLNDFFESDIYTAICEVLKNNGNLTLKTHYPVNLIQFLRYNLGYGGTSKQKTI